MLTPELEARWNAFAEASADAWFWHTTHWIEFARALTPSRWVRDCSFIIREGEEWCAICPVVLEQDGDRRIFGYSGGPVPMPAFAYGITQARRERLLRSYVAMLDALAREHDVAYVSVKVPSVAASYLEHAGPYTNPLARHGYFDLPHMTQIIDLQADEAQIWSSVRKGHKADIKRAASQCDVRFWDESTVTTERFAAYQALHRKDAGRATRSQETFDQMLGWVRRGHAVLVEASRQDRPAEFALIMRFGSGAYYGSACKDPDQQEIPALHLLQWEAMRWLKARGVRWYDLGPQEFGPLWHHVPEEKLVSIARFKRGFGGSTIPLMTGEYFFSIEEFERVFQHRMDAYVASRSAERVAYDPV
jgi:hypothetical protein